MPSSLPESLGAVLLLSDNRILAAGLHTALALHGWQVSQPNTWPDRPVPASTHIVLVAAGTGPLPDPPLGGDRGARLVAVGSRAGLPELIRALAAGADAVVDLDQPFLELVEQLHESLLHPATAEQTAAAAHRLRARQAEAERFRSLTRREREILIALTHGSTATEIALAEHLTLPTVRSHIRSVLAKLGYSSQLSVVAAAHRACAEPEVTAALRGLHQL